MKRGAAKDERSAGNERSAESTRSGPWLRWLLTVAIASVAVSCAGSNDMSDTTTDETVVRTRIPSPSLASTNWKVVEVDGMAVMSGVQPTLVFDSAGQATGETPCNRFSATVMLSGNSLIFSPLTSERTACSDTTRLAEERGFLTDMQGVKTYELDGDGQLRLLDANGQTVIRLSRVP